MVITAMENLIEELKLTESLEHSKRNEEFLDSRQLSESYQKSDRARWMLNKMYDNLVAVMKLNEKTEENDRSEEQIRTHQECFGLVAKIGQRRL